MLPRNRLGYACLLVFGLACMALPAFGADKERREVLARQRAHYLQTVESLPPLDKHRMTDLLQLRLEHGQLAFHTPLKPWPDFEGRKAKIEGLLSPIAVVYVQYIAANPAARQFEFKLEEYPDPETYSQLHMQWQPAAGGRGDELSIEHTEQTSHSFLRIFYRQGPGMARVLIFSNDTANDRTMGSENCTERDFATLRQRHPSEVERYLRPIFHKLGQDVIFAPDANTAWQVLAGDWPVSKEISDKVTQLLPDLNNPQSKVRNAAADRLADLGRDGASALLRLDRQGLTLEQNVRLDEVISRFRRIATLEAKRLELNADFLLDCQYCGDETVRKLAAARLPRVLGHSIALDPAAPESARIETVDQLRKQLHPPATQPADVEFERPRSPSNRAAPSGVPSGPIRPGLPTLPTTRPS
jgi:hypothetical protein